MPIIVRKQAIAIVPTTEYDRIATIDPGGLLVVVPPEQLTVELVALADRIRNANRQHKDSQK